MHKDAPHLDGQYAAFGKVVAGMDVVDKIASVPTDWNDKPKTPVKMKTVELIEADFLHLWLSLWGKPFFASTGGTSMKYDFTTLPDRHGRDSIAVDGLGKGFAPDAPQPGFDAIPMWVADMNFVCLPTIQQAVIERVQHPAFGYFDPTPEYYSSIIRWQETRNDVTGLTAEAIGYENGVLGGVISALNCVCSRGDKVLVHSPTYIGFTMSLKTTATRPSTARWSRMKTACGGWTLRTWRST